jgi:hypothetical protein
MKKALGYLFTPIFLNIMLFNVMSFNVAAFTEESANVNVLKAHKAKGEIIIDGINNESSWELAAWQPLDKLIMGNQPTSDDFTGQFKIVWNENQLFLLAEITDDILFDQHADPLYFYWDDDCLEIFIDEDASGGNHQFNYNAFAYHIALDNQVVDIGTNNKDGSTNFVLLNDHIKSTWRRSATKPNKIIWEVAISVFDDSFMLEPIAEKDNNNPVKLTLGKTLGFMLAYCDNDGSKERESFIGSANIKPVNGSKNLGYITADVFQQLLLIE